jgi:hypothetical protein
MGVGAYGAMLRNRNRAGVLMGNNGVNMRTYGSCVLNDITTNSVMNESVAVVSNLLTGAPTTNGLYPQPSYAVQGGMLATQSYSTQTFNSNSILVPSTYYTTLLVQCPSGSGGVTFMGTFTLSTMTVYFEVQSPNYPISTTALILTINNGLIFQMPFTNLTVAVPTYYPISSNIINLYRIGPNGGALFEVMFTPENDFTLVSDNYLNLILYGVTVSNGYTRL